MAKKLDNASHVECVTESLLSRMDRFEYNITLRFGLMLVVAVVVLGVVIILD
jgi:hypothetical protein